MTRRGPTKATMERMFAEKRAATPELTDWISCTTPPVRDGEYEFSFICDAQIEFRALFADGEWFDMAGLRLGRLMRLPLQYQWRGVRMWVLVVFDPRDFGDFDPSYLVNVSKRGVQHWSDKLNDAKPFESRAAAVQYATTVRTRSQLLWSAAVQP